MGGAVHVSSTGGTVELKAGAAGIRDHGEHLGLERQDGSGERVGQVGIPRDYSMAYPRASALRRIRTSRVTTVISGGGSPSNSAVARCIASSVRMGSTGNGLRTRASTASVTATR